MTMFRGGGGGEALWRGNEPAAMTQITDRAFSAVVEDDFEAWGTATPPGGNLGEPLTIVTDATAPETPSNVLRATYLAGFETNPGAGQAPAFTSKVHSSFAKIYICAAVKLSSNWVGNGSSVNKYGFEWTTVPHPSFFFGAWGSGSGTLSPRAFLQDIVSHGGGVFFEPNLEPTAEIVRGQWHVMEYFLQGNSASTANGSVDWYLDGVHVGSESSIQWSSGATSFDTFQVYPIWGGGNQSPAITATQTMDWDHLYVSGKN